MYEDVFRDDSWLLAEDCLDSGENKKRKSNIQSIDYDAPATGSSEEAKNKKQKRRFVWPERYLYIYRSFTT